MGLFLLPGVFVLLCPGMFYSVEFMLMSGSVFAITSAFISRAGYVLLLTLMNGILFGWSLLFWFLIIFETFSFFSSTLLISFNCLRRMI